VRPLLSLLGGKCGKALIDLQKAENYRIDPLKVRSIKNYKSLLECPAITTLVAAFDAKALKDTELLKSYFAGGNRINFHGYPAEMPLSKYLTKHMACVFYKFHICFFLTVLKKHKHTAHTFGGTKTLTHNVRTTIRLTYHYQGCKNLIHTGKTRQVKRTLIVAIVRFTIRVC